MSDSAPSERTAGLSERVSPRHLLVAATLVASVATVGSLFLSLGLGLTPCRLCWYQRILMYPLVVVIGVAAIENRPAVYRTVLPLSVGGLAIATYHSWLQVAPDGAQCTVTSCSAVLLRVGPFSIPNLSFIAFLLVTLAMGGVWWLAD